MKLLRAIIALLITVAIVQMVFLFVYKTALSIACTTFFLLRFGFMLKCRP
jgi:hypothetical protein